MDEICAKSCATSALKDFAPLIGGDAFVLVPQEEDEEEDEEEEEGEEGEQAPGDAHDGAGLAAGAAGAAASHPARKGFLDQLGERLLESSAALECEVCGVRASCLSELARHKRVHEAAVAAAAEAAGAGGLVPAPAPSELSSTRCQRCRQRCKTSAALLVHLRTCMPAPNPAPSPRTPSPPGADVTTTTSAAAVTTTCTTASAPASPATSTTACAIVSPTSNTSCTSISSTSPTAAVAASSPQASPQTSPHSSPHPMENRVFVWNNLPSPPAGTGQEDAEVATDEGHQATGPSVSAPCASPLPKKSSPVTTIKQPIVFAPVGTVKKVFKCPHCSFWASTASRFHVHIVGHLNKKPFECSLCAYRSNWRWDITKHIRLKSARDSGHERARVLMTDETGRRNYAKYNKYLTVVRVRDGNANQSSARLAGSPLTKSTTDSAKSLETAPQLVVLAPRNVTAAALASTLSAASETNVTTPPPLRQLLPAPPRLTPAPTAVASSGPPPLTLAPLRPPPPLAPAVLPGPPRLHPAPKRPAPSVVVVAATATTATAVIEDGGIHNGSATESEPPAKKINGENKRTLWKCKKCNYKDPQRELVLAHVKQHYQQRAQAVITTSAPDVTSPVSESERHCRLKHDGNVHIVTAEKCPVDSMGMLGKELSTNETPKQEEEERNYTEDTGLFSEPLQCPTCPFTCLDPEDLSQHQHNHQPQQGAIFKCYLCPYYVALKSELHDHLQLHGVSEPEEHLSRTLQRSKLASSGPPPSKLLNESDMGGHDSVNSLKRYRCAGCPYVSNSKSQFLYHKQFHRPRGAPFKCGLCTYNVSRRHLLHQHLRVHGILIPPQRSPGREPENDRTEADGLEDGEEEAAASGALRAEVPDLDTRQLPDVPLVWVSRNGRFDKLFKCRWCPHVNQRKANIMEHEKMHRRDDVEDRSEGEDTSPSPRTLPPHRCPLCNYGCHNAGVLSAHMKVHQGIYGTVRALVDLSRSDEAQLEELGAANDSLPPLLLPETSEDVTPGIEDGQEETVDFRIEPPFASEPPPSLEEEIPTDEAKILMFCQQCPARFLVMKELNIHKRFHEIRLAHRCESCSYTARQRPHLLAHIKVHSDEYQERTDALAAIYATSPAHPRSRTAVIVEGPGVSGPVWVVVSDGLSTGPAAPPETDDVEDLQDTPPPPPRPVNKQFSCSLCPAKFFKSVALEYHKTLHGGSGNYGCKYCDYRVKTYGNLVKHEMIHEHPDREISPTSVLPARSRHSSAVPLSGTDLFQQKAEVQKLTESSSRLSVDLPADPQFGTLMHGNPEFVYPMYFKNGRLKEKRYKCHKCPSAFEKREQYKVHLSLHGSKQRYKCEKCDYSVKYYANFIQHQRKHQHNDEAHAARRAAETNTSVLMEEGDEVSDEEPPKPTPMTPRSTKSIGSGIANKQVISAAEQQARMLEQVRDRVNVGLRCDEERKTLFRCAHCPYASARRDGLESHAKRHAAVSGACGAYTCKHCDYSAPQLHFLREHIKLHFDTPRKLRPEAYTHLEKLTVWIQVPDKENQTHTLVFQDKGAAGDGFERFYPPLPVELQICEENAPENRIYVDIRTGEPLSETVSKAVMKASSSEGADEIESQTGMKNKAAALKLDSSNTGGAGENEQNSDRDGNGAGNSSIGSSNNGDEDGCDGDNRDDVHDDSDEDDCDDAIDNTNRNETIAENESEDESMTSSKVEIMTRTRTARKLESHTDNSIKTGKIHLSISKEDEEGDTESEGSEDGEVDVEGDDIQGLENVTVNQKSDVPIPDDGESRLSASSSCDSSTSNSSSGSSSSSSSSSSSGTSSSSTTNESKSSDSSSDCDAEESDRVPTPTQPEASQDESLSSDS